MDMKFKFYDEIIDELKKKKFEPTLPNHANGTEFDEWIRDEQKEEIMNEKRMSKNE
jgi:hypothetical protein